MSRKDYKQFAEMLKRLANLEHKYGNPYGLEILKTVAEDMSSIFKRDNPNFDKDRFLSACEFPETEPVKL